MGRRRAGAASPEDASPPAEPPVARRSSRLAVKDRVDYNEVRIFKKILEDAPKTVPKKPKKSAEPRKTAKSKDKLCKGGAIAVRIMNEVTSTSVSTTTTRTTTTSSAYATSSRSDAPSFSMITVASSAVQQSIGVSSTTPVSSRKHARKQPARGRVASTLATVEEDVPLTMPSPRSALKRARAPSTITPDTSLMALDQETLRQRPTKKQTMKERSESPTGRMGGRVQPRGTTLFRDEEEEESAAAAAAADDTMREAMNDPLLADADWPETAVVPEKKKRKGESMVAITVPQDTKDTVIKIGQPLQGPAAKKKSRLSAGQAPSKTGRGGGNVVLFMERTVKSEDVARREVERNPRDDAFANQINEGSGELDRSISIAAGIESGTLALEDLAPDDRWMRELFSPSSTAGTPRLDHSLVTGSPLILSTSSGSSSDRSGGGTKKRQRAAGTRARKNLSLLFESESDADTTIRSPSECRETSSSSFVPAEPIFDPNRTQKYMRNKDVRALFKAATGRAAIQAAARVSSSTSSSTSSMGDETTSATRRAVQKSLQRRKIQYPGIAPLPEDLVGDDTVADVAALPALMDLVL